MSSIYQLKPAFQGLLRPLSQRMIRAGISPNQVTVSSLLLSLAGGAALLWQPLAGWPLLLLPALLLLRMALNALDGMMAREHGRTSNLGLFLNELGDVASDSALLLPLALIPGVPATPVVLLTLLAALTEMAGVCAVVVGSNRRYDGPLGKSDRAVVLGGIGLLLGLGVPAGAWLITLSWLAVLLCAVTVVNRVCKALTSLEPAQET